MERVIGCAPEQGQCSHCGQPTKVIGYETSEQLDVEPAKYFVLVTKREKRACQHELLGNTPLRMGAQDSPASSRPQPTGLSDHAGIDRPSSETASRLLRVRRGCCDREQRAVASGGIRGYVAFAFRSAAQRRFVAVMMARRPAALSLRFFLSGAAGASLAFFRDAAHRLRWAAPILARAAADIFRFAFFGGGVAPSVDPPVRSCRRSAILALMRFFCSSKPSMAAVRMSLVSLGMEIPYCVKCATGSQVTDGQELQPNLISVGLERFRQERAKMRITPRFEARL